MSPNNIRYIEALVVQFSESSGAFYAYSQGFPNDLIIDVCYCPQDVDLIGKWIEIGIDSRNRAREMVKVISDKFLTRIIRKYVEIKVEVEHDCRTNDNMEMFRNEYFGYVCDPNNLLYDIRSGVRYHVWIVRIKPDRRNCRWKVSTEQDNIDPYFSKTTMPVPTNPSRPAARFFETVVGIVTSRAKSGEFWLVWSVSRPRSSICLSYDFCPSNTEMLGKWAEMKVDERNSVREPIKIVQPRFETRTIAGLTEFRIDFKHTMRYKQEFEMFYHEYFGAISDSFKLMGPVENNAWYNGWIVYSQHFGAKSFWRLAIKQQFQGPFKQPKANDWITSSRNNGNFNSNTRKEYRPRSRSTNRIMSWDSMADHKYRPQDRSSSPEIINKYDEDCSKIHISSRSDGSGHMRSDSCSRSGTNEPCDSPRRNFNPSFTNQERRPSHSEDRRNSYQPKSNYYPEDNYDNYSSNTNDFMERSKESHTNSLDGNRKGYFKMNSISNESRDNYSEKNHESSSHQRHDPPENFDIQESSSKTSSISSNRSFANRSEHSKQEEIKIDKKENSSNLTQVNSHKAENEASISITSKEEIRILKQRLSRMSELVLSLTSDDSVSMPMKMWSVEEFEDLIELAKSNL